MSEERFDIYDEAMNLLGTASRSETHRLGHWHKSFHCWLTRRVGQRQQVLFQIRSLNKDTNPGCCDITAAGHLTAGETMRDAVRELEEELGVQASFDRLIPLGQIREQACGEVNGKPFIDRELSDVFAFVFDSPLSELRLQEEEVFGVYEADIEDMLALLEGRRETLAVSGIQWVDGGLVAAGQTIAADRFVPRDIGYYTDTFRQLRLLT